MHVLAIRGFWAQVAFSPSFLQVRHDKDESEMSVRRRTRTQPVQNVRDP